MERNTKQDIKEAALTLFSQRGYSAVSIRDICKVVGIKESTVYYHFTNKQDIFNVLLREFEEITQAIQQQFNHEFSKMSVLEEQAFVAVGLSFLNGYLLNERILPFMRMLMIEQYVNAEAASLYHDIFFDAPLRQNAMVFSRLMQMGLFHQADAACLAMEYYAPIFLIVQQYFACGEVTAEKRRAADGQLRLYLESFYEKYHKAQ